MGAVGAYHRMLAGRHNNIAAWGRSLASATCVSLTVCGTGADNPSLQKIILSWQ